MEIQGPLSYAGTFAKCPLLWGFFLLLRRGDAGPLYRSAQADLGDAVGLA